MWDSNAPLQLLKSMPKKLSKDNLEKIQLVIDADKYKNSLVSGFELCGMYAPFCRGCKKTSIYPCAIAYVNMKRSEGMDIEIDAQPVMAAEKRIFEQPVAIKRQELPDEEIAVTAEPVAEVIEEKSVIEEECVLEEPVVEETIEAQPVQQEPVKIEEVTDIEIQPQKSVNRKIRIAVARKKI